MGTESGVQQNGKVHAGKIPNPGPCSESEEQGNGTHADLSPRDERDAASAITRKNQIQRELIMRLIIESMQTADPSLDLSHKELTEIPEELLECTHIEYLYLEGNQLKTLPENFFDCLSNLVWLDLRRNYLISFPSAYVGRHAYLQTVLLEGNELKTLPLELGNLPTLRGLNICNNPLEFPPQEVIEKGTAGILHFMREFLRVKSQGMMPDYDQFEQLKLHDKTPDSSEDELKISHQSSTLRRTKSLGKTPSASRRRGSLEAESDLIGPVPQSVSLQKPQSYTEMKQVHQERLRRAGALGESRSSAKRRKSTKERDVGLYPAPPPLDRIEQKYLEESRLIQRRNEQDQQEYILQKRRDIESLKDWRNESKQMQQKKYRDSYYGIQPDYEEAVYKAPYDINKDHVKVPSKEEIIAQDVREKHEKIRRALTPKTLASMQEEREIRDKELEKRIRDHTATMQDRRRKPKGNPHDEMENAKRELEIAKRLQDEIARRRKELEYRFKAFTGD